MSSCGYVTETIKTMRPIILAALLLLAPFQIAHAQTPDFGGAWVAWLCPSGVQRESGKCANFVLELHQQGGKVCGAHLYSSAGAAEIDEGAAPSVIGDIGGEMANVVIVSGRTRAIRVRAELKIVDGVLHWQRLQNPSGDYLLPMQTRLSKARSKTLFAPVFEHELKAACLSAFTMAAEAARGGSAEPKPVTVPARP
jgi:hypothetical protein